MPMLLAPPSVAPALVAPLATTPPPLGGPGPGPLVHAALVRLAHQPAFRTVRSAPSLKEVALVEPGAAAEAATLSFSGPKGAGTVKVVVGGGIEDLEGDLAGWRDFLLQSGASPAVVALAPSLAGNWYSAPARLSFGPSLSGIGHVFCSGAACTLTGARLLSTGSSTVLSVPGFGGRLVLGPDERPLELDGTGSRAGVRLRFSYLPQAAPIRPPSSTAPLPSVLGG